ncbi:MAG: hypothetical protein F6K19_13830 [Cyanothece sp. SIO1E1]|nr:hypothetical protein [Cyanothece sp. SIO1E1]
MDGSKWLVPRLPDFHKHCPDIDIRLQTSSQVVDLPARTVDLAIRYGQGHYPGLEVYRLMTDEFTPVCSPRLRAGNHPLIQPSDLAYHSLLHFEWANYGLEAPNWKNWLALAQVKTLEPDRGLKFDDENLAIQSAIAGQGVALCSSIHVANDMALGFLAKPFDIALPGLTYAAVYMKKHPKEAAILKFAEWLIEQAQAFH